MKIPPARDDTGGSDTSDPYMGGHVRPRWTHSPHIANAGGYKHNKLNVSEFKCHTM
jgi:hypothetical protein